jgi:LVIVD repeat
VLQSSGLLARFGHESGFSQDGRTFYATGTAVQAITAIDVSDPQNPHVLWQGNVLSHGMSLSDDGNRAYVADATGGNMAILDTSEIQARKPNPQVREISRLTWDKASIPQNAIPFTSGGKPYVLEFDEYTAGTLKPGGSTDDIGAGHIIDISNEKKPRVVSLLRLQINQPKEHRAAADAGDPGTGNPAQGYAAHYCNIPTRVNPKVVACSFIASGLRVFDISNITHPKEIAYFVPPPKPRAENGGTDSNFAMSMPAFDAAHREVWYTDGETGFYDVQLAKRVWPSGASPGGGGLCAPAPHRVSVHRGVSTVVRVTVKSQGKRVRGRNVHVVGPGFDRNRKTNSKGQASFTVRPTKNGQAQVSTKFCGDALTISIRRIVKHHDE